MPDYNITNAPLPKVVVIPAQSPPSQALREWLRKSAESADVVMSVCTGAFVLADTGLLDGQAKTTHHGSYRQFETAYPKGQAAAGQAVRRRRATRCFETSRRTIPWRRRGAGMRRRLSSGRGRRAAFTSPREPPIRTWSWAQNPTIV